MEKVFLELGSLFFPPFIVEESPLPARVVSVGLHLRLGVCLFRSRSLTRPASPLLGNRRSGRAVSLGPLDPGEFPALRADRSG